MATPRLRIVRKIVTWVIALAVISGLAFAGYRYREAHKEPPVTYKTAKVEKRRIIGKVTASGTLAATVTVQVGTQISGRIKELHADFNSSVKKGQLVAKIDPLLFESAVEQANANFLSAQANLEKSKAQALDAERQLERTRALLAGNLASQKDFEAAETTASVAKATVGASEASLAQARASLNQAKVNLSYTNIISPINGTVISRSVDVGQTVAASLQAPVIFTIAEDLRKMQVNTNVAESDVGRLQSGMDVFFTVDAYPGQRFRGKIAQIRNAAVTTQNVVTYDAVIDVDNPDLKLRPGMTTNVTFIYAERDDVLAVPNAALRFRPPDAPADAPSESAQRKRPTPEMIAAFKAQGGAPAPVDNKSVYLLKNGAPAQTKVQVRLSDGTWTELIGGLNAGDEAVTDAIVAGKPSAAPANTPPPGMGRRPF
jgi:HlyD family secretion protein